MLAVGNCAMSFIRATAVALWATTLIADVAHAQVQPGCPPAAPYVAAEQPKTVGTALEIPIWKTIKVGGYQNSSAIREAIQSAPCRMAIGDDANEVLGRPAFQFIKTRIELDLVVVSVAELGFGEAAPLKDIYLRAFAHGFDLCPAEVGPALRLNYLDQPLGEFLRLAMQPISRYDGELVIFSVGNGGEGLLLIGVDGGPNATLSRSARLVFVRPRPITPLNIGERR